MAGETRPGQLPARDWGQTRQNWQDQRNQVREDWQQHRDQAREDWQNYFNDRYPAYGWHGGYAPGYWGHWDYMWDNYPVAAALGVTTWAANRLSCQFGCSDYSNPYYSDSMPACYSEPIMEAPAGATATASAPPANDAVGLFDQARSAFYDGNYAEALKLCDAAVAKMPNDAVLHEFRSLVLFALKRYGESAAAIHPVLEVGPGWDWATLSSMYANVDTYTEQLRALEAARRANPKAAELSFLLGYHYLTCSQPEPAVDMFKEALKLKPKDDVARYLVATLSPRDPNATSAPAGPAPAAVPLDSVIGTWSASGTSSSTYSMVLNKDGTFTWGYSRGGKKQESKGVFTIEGNVLAMEPDSGGTLLAELTVRGADGLLFKMIGGSPDDKGLEFKRGGPR